MNFSGKVILITGASSGIGRELAVHFSKENCSLVLLARRLDLLNDLAEQIKINNSRIEILKCDVTNTDDVSSAVNEIKNKLGRIDIAILNAGVGHRAGPKEYNSSSSKNVFDTNILGITHFIENILPDFIERRDGMIVGVSSLSDSRGWPGNGFYSASKIAVTRLLESLRIDVKQFNIKVITVKPGFVKTPMTDKNDFYMPFLMSTEKAAKKIINGIRKEKRIIQFPLPTVLGSKIVGILPDIIFEHYAAKWSKKHLS
ncbi:SDR family NAD(P)-dependent oxidoreductase [bacterium BMS3Abin03]|jgi:short-subunit dehydrogenase|nr:SDR family NAD(P)-dependent oxidoreductase [bacterium BMS3Abin03]